MSNKNDDENAFKVLVFMCLPMYTLCHDYDLIVKCEDNE